RWRLPRGADLFHRLQDMGPASLTVRDAPEWLYPSGRLERGGLANKQPDEGVQR
ncbi:MAG: hypothetical protein RL022_1304, partial [Chloroflexota bacterium]